MEKRFTERGIKRSGPKKQGYVGIAVPRLGTWKV
jgi:hypothetical protein